MKKGIIVIRAFLILALILIGAASATSTITGGMLRLQPMLVHMADQNPHQVVSVIVQKAGVDTNLEQMVIDLGGQITKNLPIIRAFAAEISLKHVLDLASRSDVRWISLDSPVSQSTEPIDISNLQSAYIQAVGASQLWNEQPNLYQGHGVTVAVVDSGACSTCQDLTSPSGSTRYLAEVSVLSCPGNCNPRDHYGHGTLIAGVIGANGSGSNRQWMGIAPGVNLVSVKVSDNQGVANASDVVSGLQWVYDNRSTYNIRIVNLSLNSTTVESYNTSPINAAVEILWFSGVVVVVPAGNNGTSELYPPANDPFVITVGATDDAGTASMTDDVMAGFSAYGTSESGFTKPDLVAPGVNLITIVPSTKNYIWRTYVNNRTGYSNASENYMRVSGTSMAASVVSGAAALLLQSNPHLTPDQVKYRLMASARQDWSGFDATKAGAGYLDIYGAVHSTTTESFNTGINASQLLWTGQNPVTWGSVAWNSVAWNSVAWNSVAWNGVAWNSVAWNSTYWQP